MKKGKETLKKDEGNSWKKRKKTLRKKRKENLAKKVEGNSEEIEKKLWEKRGRKL